MFKAGIVLDPISEDRLAANVLGDDEGLETLPSCVKGSGETGGGSSDYDDIIQVLCTRSSCV